MTASALGALEEGPPMPEHPHHSAGLHNSPLDLFVDLEIYLIYTIVIDYMCIYPLYMWLCCGMSKHQHPLDQSRHSSSVSVVVFVAEPCFFVALVKLGKSPILPAGQVNMNWLYWYYIKLNSWSYFAAFAQPILELSWWQHVATMTTVTASTTVAIAFAAVGCF